MYPFIRVWTTIFNEFKSEINYTSPPALWKFSFFNCFSGLTASAVHTSLYECRTCLRIFPTRNKHLQHLLTHFRGVRALDKRDYLRHEFTRVTGKTYTCIYGWRTLHLQLLCLVFTCFFRFIAKVSEMWNERSSRQTPISQKSLPQEWRKWKVFVAFPRGSWS